MKVQSSFLLSLACSSQVAISNKTEMQNGLCDARHLTLEMILEV